MKPERLRERIDEALTEPDPRRALLVMTELQADAVALAPGAERQPRPPVGARRHRAAAMSSFRHRPPTPGDAGAVAELVIAYERSLYGMTASSLGDLEAEWESLDLARNALLFLDGERIVAFGSLYDRGELWRIDAVCTSRGRGRGLGTELVAVARRNKPCHAGRGGSRTASRSRTKPGIGCSRRAVTGRVRLFRELRIDLEASVGAAAVARGIRSR